MKTSEGLWPTPQAHDAAPGNPKRVGRHGTEHGGRNLNDFVAHEESQTEPPELTDQLMLSAEGFPVRTSPPPAEAPASTGSGRDSGANSPVSLARYDPDTRSWRTSQLCLDGALAEFSETFPRSGMTRNGTAYRLPPLVRLIGGTGYGSLPTPMAADAKGLHNKNGNAIGPKCLTEAARVMWPTPTVNGNNNRKGLSKDSGDGLATAAKTWPSPRAADGMTSPLKFPPREAKGRLEDAVANSVWPAPTSNRRSGLQSHGVNAVSGALNPTWVEWLMGFPLGWTDLEASETPSCPKSSKP